MEEITLEVRGKTFKVEREVLCEYSDYFRVMFSGNFREHQETEIVIDMVEASTMSIIIQYMITGSIDLLEYSFSTIVGIANAADFLQMTTLSKKIEHTLFKLFCKENKEEITSLAERCSYQKIQQLYAAFELYSFKRMNPEQIPTIDKLAWYLSHPYLDTQCELDVFTFGLQWIVNNEAGADALLIVLVCLDYKRLTGQDICEIKNCMREQLHENSLAAEVVDCFSEVLNTGLEISDTVLKEQKSQLCEKFTDRIYALAVDIVRKSNNRILDYTLVVYDLNPLAPMKTFHRFSIETGFKEWRLRENPGTVFISITSWGLTNLVFLLKDKRLPTNVYERDFVYYWQVKVYDTLRKEWLYHNIDIPIVDNVLGITVFNDCLFIFSVETEPPHSAKPVIIYDLKEKTYEEIAKLPEDSFPAACTHKNMMYVALKSAIYCYEESGIPRTWRAVMGNDIDITCMASYNNYIYCIERESTKLYKFRPEVDRKLQIITNYSTSPYSIVNAGSRLLAFIQQHLIELVVEELNDKNEGMKPKEVYRERIMNKGHPLPTPHAVVTKLPELYKGVSFNIAKYI